MKKVKKQILVSLIVGLFSQISIGLMNSDFRVSVAVIFFEAFIIYYDDLKIIPTGLLSGITVYIFRLISYYLMNGNISNVIFSYLLEIVFYVFYAIIFSVLTKNKTRKNLNYLFLIMVISDFSGNLLEVILRNMTTDTLSPSKVSFTLLIVSIVRSAIAWLILNGIKYYKMLIMKEEHEHRYKKLLWLTSQLKTEMYWIEKNMDNIEEVMSKSYKLYEKIKNNMDRETWEEGVLNIARDVHEIKKENYLIFRGLKAITDKELADKGMNIKDIINILSETMKREIKELEKNIELEFKISYNFYTSKHYYLMSILRNLVMNSIDAIPESKKDGKITIEEGIKGQSYYFTVSDNGSGIDDEELKDIFSPGFSTKINYDTGEINRGLGLSIVQYIVVEQLRGTLSVSSVIGKGTKFEINIPREILEEKNHEDLYS